MLHQPRTTGRRTRRCTPPQPELGRESTPAQALEAAAPTAAAATAAAGRQPHPVAVPGGGGRRPHHHNHRHILAVGPSHGIDGAQAAHAERGHQAGDAVGPAVPVGGIPAGTGGGRRGRYHERAQLPVLQRDRALPFLLLLRLLLFSTPASFSPHPAFSSLQHEIIFRRRSPSSSSSRAKLKSPAGQGAHHGAAPSNQEVPELLRSAAGSSGAAIGIKQRIRDLLLPLTRHTKPVLHPYIRQPSRQKPEPTSKQAILAHGLACCAQRPGWKPHRQRCLPPACPTCPACKGGAPARRLPTGAWCR